MSTWRSPRARRALAAAVAGTATVAVGVAAAVLGLRAAAPADYAALPDPAGPRVAVTVTAGEPLAAIGAGLARAGVVASAAAFTRAAAADPAAAGVQPGTYPLPRHLPARVALQALLGAGPAALALVDIPAGFTLAQVTDRLTARTHLTRAAVLAALADPGALGLPADAAGHAEGWLAPGRYPVAPSDTAVAVLAAMVARQRQAVAAAGLPAAAAAQHRSVTALLTIASIAQAEAIPAEYAKVARVVDNRLGAGMRLQMDSTVNYARGTHTLNLGAAELADPSAYNTYRHPGLPPTPIGAPGPAALAAAAHPAPGPWRYFVLAGRDGHSFFTADYAAFTQAVAAARAAHLF